MLNLLADAKNVVAKRQVSLGVSYIIYLLLGFKLPAGNG